MKLLLGIFFVLAIAGSFYADFRWKRWMAARKEARERGNSDLEHPE